MLSITPRHHITITYLFDRNSRSRLQPSQLSPRGPLSRTPILPNASPRRMSVLPVRRSRRLLGRKVCVQCHCLTQVNIDSFSENFKGISNPLVGTKRPLSEEDVPFYSRRAKHVKLDDSTEDVTNRAVKAANWTRNIRGRRINASLLFPLMIPALTLTLPRPLN